MKLNNFKIILNAVLIIWIAVWLYYLAFNWDVFSVQLKTNLGFAVITGYPFLFFSIFGLLLLLTLKYSYHIIAMQQQNRDKDKETKTTLLEKDIEILKLKEVLFKMQTKDMNESASALHALQEKLDNISEHMAPTSEPKEENKENDNQQDKNNAKKGDKK